MAAAPVFLMLFVAVAAGLLAVFVVWVSKQIADKQTRSRGITTAALVAGLLILGIFITRSSHQRAPVAIPSGGGSADFNGGMSISADGHVEMYSHREHRTVESYRPATPFAWRPLTMAAIVVAAMVLLATLRKGQAAALAGLGIVAGLIVMYLWAARREVTTISEAVPPVAWTAEEAVDNIPATDAAPPASVAGTAAEKETPAEAPSDHIVTPPSKADEESSSKSDADASKREPVVEKEAATRPAWVGSEPTMESGVYRASIVSGPYSTRRECERRLDGPLSEAMREYANDYLRPSARYHAWTRWQLIRDRLIEEQHFEQAPSSVGPMWNLYVLLKVDQSAVAYFDQLAHQSEVRQSVELASVGGLCVLGVLVVLYGGLRYAGRKKAAAAPDGSTTAPSEATV